jgi:exopolysaccharide biosynthesis protein
MFKRIFVVCAVLALFGSGCQNPMNPQGPASTKAAPSEAGWKNVAPDIARYECEADVCGSRLILYRFAKDKFAWRFENRAAPSTVEAWARSLPQAVMVANGVYFDEHFQPTGLLKTAGVLANDRKYDLDKSGLLELSPAVSVIDTAMQKIDLAKMTEVAQSFPFIVKKGSPITAFKDQKAARRTFIGTDKNGDVYIGAVPEDAITFVDLAKLLAKTGVKWNNVLNLDGGTSTGFSVHDGSYEETMNSIVQVPNVIVAERK